MFLRKLQRVSIASMATLFVGLSMSWTVVAHAETKTCQAAHLTTGRVEIAKVEIPQWTYQKLTVNLRNTLSGKLATVFRSEWKSKLEIQNANSYVKRLVEGFMTPETQGRLLGGLNETQEGFVRQIHERLYELQKSGSLKENDELLVRDAPPPKGAADMTFTYYTKPIVHSAGAGKHQFRVRTYLRTIDFKLMEVDQPVEGFDGQGRSISFTRLSSGKYQVQFEKNNEKNDLVLEERELTARFGQKLTVFAPHGKSFKLEDKTALEDEIQSQKYEWLHGPHMVQKLDASLSLAQVKVLFAPLTAKDSAGRRRESLNRIDQLKKELTEGKPELKARVDALFDVMVVGVQGHPDFLEIEGATLYRRTAFEGKSGFQTTIDRDQGVYLGNMYLNSSLRSPIETLQQNTLKATGVDDARHVELKVPAPLVLSTLGLQFKGTAPELPPADPKASQQILSAIGIYYPFVSHANHPGKFNYLIRRAPNSVEFERAHQIQEMKSAI